MKKREKNAKAVQILERFERLHPICADSEENFCSAVNENKFVPVKYEKFKADCAKSL